MTFPKRVNKEENGNKDKQRKNRDDLRLRKNISVKTSVNQGGNVITIWLSLMREPGWSIS